MAADLKISDEKKVSRDTLKEQLQTPNNQNLLSAFAGNSRKSTYGRSFILTNKHKLKRSKSVQCNLPKCTCIKNGLVKPQRPLSSPLETLGMLSLPIATLNTPLTSPTLDVSTLSSGDSSPDTPLYAFQNLSFEDELLEIPPPSYSSLIQFTLLDIPPDYEAVTGIPLACDLVSCI